MDKLSAECSSRPGLRSASHFLYQKPALKTKFGERAFSYAGPAAWNSLPEYIQMDLNTNCFKKLLKTYLYASSFQLFILFYRLTYYEMSAGLLCRWTISLYDFEYD